VFISAKIASTFYSTLVNGDVMDTLWAPWRMDYIKNNSSKKEGCIFCAMAAEEEDERNLILHRGQHAFIIMNRFPYTNGHLMILPYSHHSSICQLTVETRAEMMELLFRAEMLLRKMYEPDGLNIGANVGSAAGAGVAEHIHFHILPRWFGDTNFMSTVGKTRVVPEDIHETYRNLLKIWQELLDFCG
jgi:ATP adenylyltransferase